mmetsp:Transcript_24370/g.50837  ORF Transcript_24370/g.50837 Transcript_24370/m.50837 type:complete len:203 (-) Transcript_24370:1935-2543(-)
MDFIAASLPPNTRCSSLLKNLRSCTTSLQHWMAFIAPLYLILLANLSLISSFFFSCATLSLHDSNATMIFPLRSFRITFLALSFLATSSCAYLPSYICRISFICSIFSSSPLMWSSVWFSRMHAAASFQVLNPAIRSFSLFPPVIFLTNLRRNLLSFAFSLMLWKALLAEDSLILFPNFRRISSWCFISSTFALHALKPALS